MILCYIFGMLYHDQVSLIYIGEHKHLHSSVLPPATQFDGLHKYCSLNEMQNHACDCKNYNDRTKRA